uniref:Uncharacterized protein n=1 Tax=Rhizophora mucronata TaxID=61149 RepID=A0A2P2QFT3_RHIMU
MWICNCSELRVIAPLRFDSSINEFTLLSCEDAVSGGNRKKNL